MQSYSLAHVSDSLLLRDLAALVARDRATTAMLLAHIAEVDARKIYVSAGYPSMHAYCVEGLHLSEDAAKKRIQAARAGRRFPMLFSALAEGRLHLTAVWLLAPHLTPENAGELIEGAVHKRRVEIEELLARRFPPPEPSRTMRVVTPMISNTLQNAEALGGEEVTTNNQALDEGALGHLDRTQQTVASDSTERFLVQLTITKSTRGKLRYAQALLSHSVPTGDLAQVLDRALDALIAKLERRKFGAATRRPPRPAPPPREAVTCPTAASGSAPANGSAPRNTPAPRRHVPAQVRRAVWERDQGQCTYVSASGHRCKSRRFLEFDHADPVARGGKSTVDGMRLRCRAHNQYEAERMFGAAFMERKRLEARLAAADARTLAAAQEARTQAAAESRAQTVAQEQSQDVLAGLRRLGCWATEARRAVELSGNLHGATLEERLRLALQHVGRT